MPPFPADYNGLNESLHPLLMSAAIYMRAGLASSTLKQYDHAWLHYTSFCSTFRVCPMPVNISVLSAFLVHCVEGRNLRAASVTGLLAGIQFHARCMDPSTASLVGNPSIRLLLNGFRKLRPQGNDKRLPFTPSLLHGLINRLRQGCFGDYVDSMLEVALLTAFYGFLRVGEYTTRTQAFDPSRDLTVADITLHEQHFTLHLKHSKSDRNNIGVDIVISSTNTTFCPLSCMRAYLARRPAASGDEPLFLTAEGRPMTGPWFAAKLRLLCLECGLPPGRYTAHSLRIGAATTAASVAPVSTLKALGRWSSGAYSRYLRPTIQDIAQTQKAMSRL